MSRKFSAGSRREWSESDVKVRPNKKGNRPRTKETPAHREAQWGRVLTVDRGRYTVQLSPGAGGAGTTRSGSGSGPEGSDAQRNQPEQQGGATQQDQPGRGPAQQQGAEQAHTVTAVRATALRRRAIVPGDIVGLVGDTSGAQGSLARLVRLHDRATLLRRSAEDTDDSERVIVANADQLLIVVAAAEPEPRTGFVDRALVAAYDAGIEPLLLITKADLADDAADPAGLVRHYAELDLSTVISARAGEGQGLEPAAVAELYELLDGHITALIGHSGVGKSTMVNELTGSTRATSGVNTVTGRGRHTSSSAVAIPLASASAAAGAMPKGSEDSWIIDTPGVRTFGLAHVAPDDVLGAFADLVEGSADCEPGCAHASPRGGCALDAWVEQGHAGPHGPARLASLRSLLASLSGSEEGPADKQLGGV